MERINESYKLNVDNINVNINILKEKGKNPRYEIATQKIASPTLALLDEIKEKLIEEVKLTSEEILDEKVIEKLKERFKEKASDLLKIYLKDIPEKTKDYLIGTLMHESLGLGLIEFLLNDKYIEEIVISASKIPVMIYHKKYGWLETNIILQNEDQILNYSNIIARRVGRQITTLNPLLDAHLVTGDRVNAVLYPISTKGNTITIRKFSEEPLTVTDLINDNVATSEIFALIWLALEYEMNMLVSGGTASGKTTFLNVCMPFIPPNNRIISIEDTRELALPKELYWTPLVTRQPNPEGEGKVTMLDLLVNSLRMRPDRIILGEIRRKQEAEVLFEAMHTGHSVYATVHADSISETIRRLTNPPISVPPNLLSSVNLNVVMFRDRRRGIRRVLQIAEIEVEGDNAKANTLYRWSAETDSLVKHSKSSKFFEDISRHTSMSENEINKEIQIKKKIIEWLIKNKVRSLDDLGMAINLYYQNKELLLKKMAKNDINFVLNYGK